MQMTRKKRRYTYKERLLSLAKRHKKRADFHALIMLFILGLILVSGQLISFAQVPEVEEEETLVTATLLGDLMFGRYMNEVTERKGYDDLFTYVTPYLESSDYVTGNFKQTITDRPLGMGGEEILDGIRENESKAYPFETSYESIRSLIRHNFTNVSLANNNQFDYDLFGFHNTLEVFEHYDELPIIGAGSRLNEAQEPHITEVGELTIATLGFTDIYAPNYAADDDRAGVLTTRRLQDVFVAVEEARTAADLLIVHAHWGENFDSSVHSRQREIAHRIADLGADIIVGHYPHVISPVEIYDDTIILYSVGNFTSDQGWSRTSDSLVTQYKLYDDGKAVLEFVPMSIREGQPKPANGWVHKLQRERIYRMLSKELPDTFEIERDHDRMRILLDHEHVLAH